MTTELDSFEEAAELALAEMDEAPSIDPEPAEPAGDEEAQDESGQVESSEDEQPESQEQEAQEAESDESEDEESEEEESLFSDVEPEEDEVEAESGPVSIEDLGEDALIDLGPGHEPKTLREIREDGLRLDDYTRKTQEVSEQRKSNEKAIKLWEALQKEPQAVVKQLAVEAGYLDEEATPVKAVDFKPLQTAEEREAEIEEMVQQRVEEHPDVKEARKQSAWQTINAEFDRIEKEYDTPLNAATREDVLAEAKRRGVADLELVFSNMLARKQRKQQDRQKLKDAAPSKASGQTTTEANTEPAGSFEEAAQRAMLELGLSD